MTEKSLPKLSQASKLSTQSAQHSAGPFQDLPLLDRFSRLTVLESGHSERQIINELVYRWCRILTRSSSQPSDAQLQLCRRVLLIDLVGATSVFRLATVLKRDIRRLQMIGVVRGCKLNSTYVTLESYLSRQTSSSSLKLVVIHQDEFYILKTISLINEFLQTQQCQVVLVVPRLDRQERDVLSLTSNCQILRCNFNVSRREIGPSPPEFIEESYSAYLNQVQFQRTSKSKTLPDKVEGEIREDGLYLKAVIIDCAPSPNVSNKQFTKWLDSVVTFCNSHMMLDEKNELTIIASYTTASKFIISTDRGIKTSRDIVPQDGQFEKFAFVTDILRKGIIDLMSNNQPSATNDCLLSSALGMALCKINNMKNTPARILVASCSMQIGSYASQYMNLMNSFFAAQKIGVPIDGCVFLKEDAKRGSILEQGCDLTDGHFLNVPDIAGNLEYLLWIFLPSNEVRKNLLLPERRKATHRAACFCHRNIIDIGYVCSVCLSIFCTFSPICSSCQTHFKLDLPTKVINKIANDV